MLFCLSTPAKERVPCYLSPKNTLPGRHPSPIPPHLLTSHSPDHPNMAAKNLVGCLKQNGSGVINLSKFLGEAAACPESTFLQAAAQYSTTGGVAAYKLPELSYGYSALGMSVVPIPAPAAVSPGSAAEAHTHAHTRVPLSLSQSLSSAARSWSCTTTSTTART